MLPLYVRNTLLEKNGTTPGGDQPFEVMAADRRYSHYIGRPLNRFEPNSVDNVNLNNSDLLKSITIDTKSGKSPTTKSNINHEHSNSHSDSYSNSYGSSYSNSKTVKNSKSRSDISNRNKLSNTAPASLTMKTDDKKEHNNLVTSLPAIPNNNNSYDNSNSVGNKNTSDVSNLMYKGSKRAAEAAAKELLAEKERKEKIKEERIVQKIIREEMEKVKIENIPITKSLVRHVFANKEPDLSDLRYLDD